MLKHSYVHIVTLSRDQMNRSTPKQVLNITKLIKFNLIKLEKKYNSHTKKPLVEKNIQTTT